MATQTHAITIDQLATLPDGDRYELWDGELKPVTPAGYQHGRIAGFIAKRLIDHIGDESLGDVVVEAGFIIDRKQDTMLAPDVAFVSAERLQQAGDFASYFPGPPDLAVEIVSPNDKAVDVEEKTRRWLDAGVRLLWVVWPNTRSVTVYEPGQGMRSLEADATITGGQVLPDFKCKVSELFD